MNALIAEREIARFHKNEMKFIGIFLRRCQQQPEKKRLSVRGQMRHTSLLKYNKNRTKSIGKCDNRLLNKMIIFFRYFIAFFI